jgi:hypothetical protein
MQIYTTIANPLKVMANDLVSKFISKISLGNFAALAGHLLNHSFNLRILGQQPVKIPGVQGQ